MKPIKFEIEKKIKHRLGRVGKISTPHGDIQTPAFVTVGTKATVKALSPKDVEDLGAQVVLANTYHLYLQPGDELIAKAGGLHKFMNWNKPTMTDSGGFQAFSLGAAFGQQVSKIAKDKTLTKDGRKDKNPLLTSHSDPALATINEDGVTFKSHIDGSKHLFTPEKSMEIQHNIGADIMFAFDECTSPHASYEYQEEALERTHRWAERSLKAHKKNKLASSKQGLFGIVQGGRFEDLRKKSAKVISKMDFDGFGVGGSFDKEDMDTAVGWVNKNLPEDKPRHLLGIGEPLDLFGGIENGCDLFDCVAPTRTARNGTLHTRKGRMNILNARFVRDLKPVEKDCTCYTCQNFTRAYLSHLFRAKEMYGATLASIHNLHFIVTLVDDIRQSILDNKFDKYKESFIKKYYN